MILCIQFNINLKVNTYFKIIILNYKLINLSVTHMYPGKII